MTSWTIRVDVAAETVDYDRVGDFIDALAGHHPAIASARHGSGARLEVTITIDDGTLRQATATALQLVENATGMRAVGLEVLTTAAFDARLEEPTIPPLVGNIEISELLGVSRQRASQLAASETFPPALVVTKAGPLRAEAAVRRWATTWTRKAGRPAKVDA